MNTPLHRRTFLRGLGAAIALPMLDAMVPALVDEVSHHPPDHLGADAAPVQRRVEEEVDAVVRRRLGSYSRPLAEGSAEWETLYRKAFEDEMRKRMKG